MKKLTLFLVVILISVESFAQVIRFQENFDLGTIPTGWTNTAVRVEGMEMIQKIIIQ